MKQIIILPMLFCFLTAGSNGIAKEQTVLTDQSYGFVRFGSKLVEVEKKIGERAKGQTSDQGCDFVTKNILVSNLWLKMAL